MVPPGWYRVYRTIFTFRICFRSIFTLTAYCIVISSCQLPIFICYIDINYIYHSSEIDKQSTLDFARAVSCFHRRQYTDIDIGTRTYFTKCARFVWCTALPLKLPEGFPHAGIDDIRTFSARHRQTMLYFDCSIIINIITYARPRRLDNSSIGNILRCAMWGRQSLLWFQPLPFLSLYYIIYAAFEFWFFWSLPNVFVYEYRADKFPRWQQIFISLHSRPSFQLIYIITMAFFPSR